MSRSKILQALGSVCTSARSIKAEKENHGGRCLNCWSLVAVLFTVMLSTISFRGQSMHGQGKCAHSPFLSYHPFICDDYSASSVFILLGFFAYSLCSCQYLFNLLEMFCEHFLVQGPCQVQRRG